MKLKATLKVIGGGYLLLLALFLLSPLRLFGDVTNCNGGHFPSSGGWSVADDGLNSSVAWLGDNYKVMYLNNVNGPVTEEVHLTGDIQINDRVFIGVSTEAGVKPAHRAKLTITNVGLGRSVTIRQNVWRSKATTSEHNQTVDNNCMFSVWGNAELEIVGDENHPIIIDGGSGNTDITDWETTTPDHINGINKKPFNKIIWGLIESNGTLTLKNVIFRNVVFSSMKANDPACECSCIKLNAGSNEYVGYYTMGSTTLENVTFKNVYSPGGGGCILTGYGDYRKNSANTNCSVTMKNCTVENTVQEAGSNPADPQGLMRFNEYFTGNVTMDNCKFLNNTAGRSCAGILWQTKVGKDGSGFAQPKLTINNGKYIGNTSTSGSAVYIKNGDAVMTGDATFENNKTTMYNGGAMYVESAKLTIEKASFKNNSAADFGGAIIGQTADITINQEANFEGNHADGGGGGAICSYYKNKLTINNATFRNNYALSSGWSGRGGALFVYQGGAPTGTKCVQINGATFEGNKAKVGGGAVFIMNDWVTEANNDYQEVLIKDATFRNNVSASGGAIGIDGQMAGGDDTPRNVKLTLENNVIEDNWACLGGGLLVQEAQVTYKGGLIRNNVANHRKKKDMIAESTDETIDTTDGKGITTGHTIEGLWNNDTRTAGYGGGVALTQYGWLKIDTSSKFGIYNNKALLGGDDILSDGSQSYSNEVNLPDLWSGTADLEGLNLPAELKKGLRWMEDYNAEDGNYASSITAYRGKGYKPGDKPGRYRELSASRSKELVKKTFDAGQYNDGYLSVALGYPFIYVTVEKTGLLKGETALFDIYGNGDATGNPYMTICITNKDGDESKCKRIVALTPGKWTVKEKTDWAYTYNVKAGTNSQITQELKTEDVAKGTTYTFKFENVKKGAAELVPSAEAAKQNPDMKKEQ